jgi:hypothetical protein
MTTYAYRITLNTSEAIAVQAALEHYRKICEAEMAAGAGAPYRARAHWIDAVLPRLRDDGVMTSTSSFCEDAG